MRRSGGVGLGRLRKQLLMHYLVADAGARPEAATVEEVAELAGEGGRHAREGVPRKLDRSATRAGAAVLVMLGVIDEKWKDHLYDLDHLKASIGFRGGGRRTRSMEYKQEA